MEEFFNNFLIIKSIDTIKMQKLHKLRLQNVLSMHKKLVSFTKGEKKKENVEANMDYLYRVLSSTISPPKGPETNAMVLEHYMKLQINQILDQIEMCFSWITNPKEMAKVADVISAISIHKLSLPMSYIEKNKDKINKKSDEQYEELEQQMSLKYDKYIHRIKQKLRALYEPHMYLQQQQK